MGNKEIELYKTTETTSYEEGMPIVHKECVDLMTNLLVHEYFIKREGSLETIQESIHYTYDKYGRVLVSNSSSRGILEKNIYSGKDEADIECYDYENNLHSTIKAEYTPDGAFVRWVTTEHAMW